MNPIEILERIGLTSGESKVYLALIELGSTTTGHIIEKSEVSASKVYEILEKLIRKGLVSYIVKEKTRIYTPQDPSNLINFLDEEKKKIEENKIAIEKIIPELLLKKSKGAAEPVAQVFEGKRGYILSQMKILEELDDFDKYYTLTVVPTTLMFAEHLNEFNKARMKKKVSMWIIYPKEGWYTDQNKAEERKKRSYYYPRICSEQLYIPLDISITRKACRLTMVTDKIISIIIRNQAMIDGFKKYFEGLWKASKTPEGYPEYKGDLF